MIQAAVLALPPLQIISVTGGSFFCGITLVLTLQSLWQFGLEISLWDDRKRQTLLNVLCLSAALTGMISYPLNQTQHFTFFCNILSIIMFTCAQYGLVILNHNSLARANNISETLTVSQLKLDVFCYLLYFLPLATLMPIYFAAMETIPINQPLNFSLWNRNVYKPLNIGLGILTTNSSRRY
jgi:hypothetical protein